LALNHHHALHLENLAWASCASMTQESSSKQGQSRNIHDVSCLFNAMPHNLMVRVLKTSQLR
jgi:hypothetical protein